MRTNLTISICVMACDTSELKTTTGVEDSALPSDWFLSNQPDWVSTEMAYATGIAFLDVDRDGDMDLIVSEGNDMEPGLLRLYENDGVNLETSASWSSQNPQYYGHLAVGDLNGDGWTDVAVSRFLGENRFESPGGVEVFLNVNGAFNPVPDWEDEGIFSFSLALGDSDRDGDLDMVVCGGESYFHDPEPSRLYKNNGFGHFVESMRFNDSYRMDAAFVDLNHDGWLDLIFAEQMSPHSVHYNQGPGFLPYPDISLTGESFEGNTLDWGDVDADGNVDIVVSDNDQQGGSGLISLWCGPDFRPCWESEDPPSMRSAVSLHDMDADGDLDLVSGAWWGPVLFYENKAGSLNTIPTTINGNDNRVVEAFAWTDRDGSHEEIMEITGQHLLSVPRHIRPILVNGGVLGDGYVTGAGSVSLTFAVSPHLDLAVSDWEPLQGNVVFPLLSTDQD